MLRRQQSIFLDAGNYGILHLSKPKYAWFRAVGLAVRRFGLLDRLIILRVSVNMDVFPTGVTPEMLWDPAADDRLASDDSMESVDIFETAMQNCFAAGSVLIDAILEGRL